MPRRKKYDDGHEENRNARVDTVTADGRLVSVSGVFGVPPNPARTEAAAAAFLDILSREDGWLRVIGGGSEKQHYYKYKFSRGRWQGMYVMYVTVPGKWEEGMIGLAQKLAAVDDGTLKPAHDTFYDPR